jgi:hypothetical protein
VSGECQDTLALEQSIFPTIRVLPLLKQGRDDGCSAATSAPASSLQNYIVGTLALDGKWS